MSNSDDIFPALKEVGNRLRRKAMKALSPEPAPKLPRHPRGPVTDRTRQELERLIGGAADGGLFNALSELIDRHDWYADQAGDPRVKYPLKPGSGDDGAR